MRTYLLQISTAFFFPQEQALHAIQITKGTSLIPRLSSAPIMYNVLCFLTVAESIVLCDTYTEKCIFNIMSIS